MKIAYNGRFLSSLRMTGVERVAWNLLKTLVVSDPSDEYVIFCGHKELVKELVSASNVTVIECELLNKGRLLKHFWEQTVLPGLVRKHSCGVLFNPVNTGPVFFSGRSVLFLCDVSFLVNPSWFSKNFSFAYGRIVPMAAKAASAVITISESSKKDIARYLSVKPEKIRVAYPAVEKIFAQDGEKNSEILSLLKVAKPYILFAGSMDPRKNLLNLVRAFVKLKRDTQLPHELIIAGANNVNFKTIDFGIQINEGNIRFIGYVNDAELKSLYQEAEVFVYPSLYEGFGLPPLEAMACGTPVIVSNTSSLPEVCGDAAYYVDPLNIESIADGMRAVLDNEELKSSMRVKGLERASKFRWGNCAKETLEVLKEVFEK